MLKLRMNDSVIPTRRTKKSFIITIHFSTEIFGLINYKILFLSLHFHVTPFLGSGKMEQYIPPTIVFLLSYSKNHRSFKNHLKSFFPRSASFTHAIPRVHDLWNKIYRTLEISVYKLKLSIQFFPRKVLANSSHDIFRNHGNCPLYIYIAELLNFQTHNKLLDIYIYQWN